MGNIAKVNTSSRKMTSVFCEELACTRTSRFAQVVSRDCGHEIGNAVMAMSQRFAVIPDLNPLVFGHSLLVTKQFQKSLMRCEMADATELLAVLQECSKGLNDSGVPHEVIFCFEHGAGIKSTRIICGTDHAHLHLLPTSVDAARRIFNRANVQAEKAGLVKVNRLTHAEYLYLGCFDSSSRRLQHLELFSGSVIPSQFMRQIVGEVFDVREWNWKETDSRRLSPESIPQCFNLNVVAS